MSVLFVWIILAFMTVFIVVTVADAIWELTKAIYKLTRWSFRSIYYWYQRQRYGVGQFGDATVTMRGPNPEPTFNGIFTERE